jgi:D-glycero-alpha-D-manno-heptose-7-phosphate kinase
LIGTMTPFRISFAGGGSDLKTFYATHPGCVVSTTINKHMFLFVHPSFDDKTQIKYSRTETVDKIEDIRHPIVRETLKIFGLKGVEISSIADIPAGTGLGSSSAFTVGLFNALYALRGTEASKEQIARAACNMEIEILKEPIGRQDQYASAFGGLNFITFHEDDTVSVEPIVISPHQFKVLESNLLLFYTGGHRRARPILHEQSRRSANHRERSTLIRMTELAKQLRDSLSTGTLDDLGEILDESWQLKKSLSSGISHDQLDDLYRIARKNGARGGKLLGAGGEGFFLFYCPQAEQEGLRKALQGFRETAFSLDPLGTRIILNTDEPEEPSVGGLAQRIQIVAQR